MRNHSFTNKQSIGIIIIVMYIYHLTEIQQLRKEIENLNISRLIENCMNGKRLMEEQLNMQTQTKLSEQIISQKEELEKVKSERKDVMKKIIADKENISKELNTISESQKNLANEKLFNSSSKPRR